MPDNQDLESFAGLAEAAKQYVIASKSLAEELMRPYGLGSGQWFVLQQLRVHDTLEQRLLGPMMRVERATASDIVLALVRKGLVAQSPSPDDQRQKVLRITDEGRELSTRLPDLLTVLYQVAFTATPPEDVAIATRVLADAIDRLESARGERKIS